MGMMDREKVIKWLEYDYLPRVGAYRKDCKQGCDACMPMHDGDDYCDIDMLWKIIVLLKEQENCEDCAIAIEDRLPVVRCKDCKWSKPEKVFKNVPTSKDMVRWCELITRYVDDDWFCADGVAKDINVLGKEGR